MKQIYFVIPICTIILSTETQLITQQSFLLLRWGKIESKKNLNWDWKIVAEEKPVKSFNKSYNMLSWPQMCYSV